MHLYDHTGQTLGESGPRDTCQLFIPEVNVDVAEDKIIPPPVIEGMRIQYMLSGCEVECTCLGFTLVCAGRGVHHDSGAVLAQVCVVPPFHGGSTEDNSLLLLLVSGVGPLAQVCAMKLQVNPCWEWLHVQVFACCLCGL